MYTCKWVFHPHISPSLPTAATFIVQNLHSLWIFVPSSRHHITTGTTMCGIAKSALSSGRKPQRQDNCQVSCHYLETLKINSRRIILVVEQSHYRGGWVLLWPGRCPSGSVSWFGGRLDSDKNPEIRLAICLSVMAQMWPPNDLRYCESFAKINAHQFITRVRFARDQKILHMCGMRIEINSSRRARNVTDIMNIRNTLLVESFRRIAVIYHPSARLIGTSPLTGALYPPEREGG